MKLSYSAFSFGLLSFFSSSASAKNTSTNRVKGSQHIRALSPKSGSGSGSSKKGSGALSALIETLPGSLPSEQQLVYRPIETEVFGTATVRCNQDGSFLLQINAQGLDTNCDCDTCKVAIYDGTSCDTPGSAYFNGDEDPWSSPDPPNYYFAYGDGGLSNSAFVITNGYTCDENEGRVVVMYDSSLMMVGCGVLGEASTTNELEVDEWERYPGYTGDLEPEGKVKVTFNSDDTFEFSFDLKDLQEDVTGGVHIHAGTLCASAGGHYSNTNLVRDLWTVEGGSVYSTENKGKAKGSFNLYNGYGIEENVNHAVVIHAADGTRVACGVLDYKD